MGIVRVLRHQVAKHFVGAGVAVVAFRAELALFPKRFRLLQRLGRESEDHQNRARRRAAGASWLIDLRLQPRKFQQEPRQLLLVLVGRPCRPSRISARRWPVSSWSFLIEQRLLGRVAGGRGVGAQPDHRESWRPVCLRRYRDRGHFRRSRPSPLPVSSSTACSVARRFCVSKNSVVLLLRVMERFERGNGFVLVDVGGRVAQRFRPVAREHGGVLFGAGLGGGNHHAVGLAQQFDRAAAASWCRSSRIAAWRERGPAARPVPRR